MPARLFGRIPPVNILILAVQLLGIGHISWNYDLHFVAKPILTSMITNSLLNGIGDTVAQCVTSARRHHGSSWQQQQQQRARKDGVSIEIHELGEKGLPLHRPELSASSVFDAERLVRYMAWGFLMAPLQLAWFSFLSDKFPLDGEHNTAAALWRVLCDQVLFSPIGLALFFLFMTVAEGGGSKAVRRKFDGVFVSALKSNYVLWPAVQILNFRVFPLQLQLPFASTVGIGWTTYLSLKNDTTNA